MIGSCELKARVEESLGTVLDPDLFGQAEQYARRKLDMCLSLIHIFLKGNLLL